MGVAELTDGGPALGRKAPGGDSTTLAIPTTPTQGPHSFQGGRMEERYVPVQREEEEVSSTSFRQSREGKTDVGVKLIRKWSDVRTSAQMIHYSSPPSSSSVN